MKRAEPANLPEFEAEMMQVWEAEKTFEMSVEQRVGSEHWSFYDGPPFANGLPHFGHSLVTSIKDSLGRYHTMRGQYVPRRNGWDTHGLPVEFAIEKQLGVSGKKQILELGLEKFNEACRASVFKYRGEWEDFYRRIGRWTDTEHAYAAIDRNYTESVWWVLKQVHERGLLYKGFKSMPYCPRCETPLSNFEVNEGYKDNVPDPSLYVKFKLVDEDASLLGWTTTPWSLPGNAAVAVNPEEQYVYARVAGDALIVAKKRLEAVFKDEATYEIIREVAASELVGKRYEPLFALEGLEERAGQEQLYQVWAAPVVSVEDGTGVLHVAPAFGEDDLNLGQANNIPVLQTIDASGHVKSGLGFDEIAGQFFKEADRTIVDHLTKQGAVWAAETFTHTYPFCYRCDSPLLYYAIDTWFVAVSAIKGQLLETAGQINWTPSHIKDGRFGKWLEGARDWAISRNRYWGAPMPIWVNVADEHDYIVVGSLDELRQLAGPEAMLDDLHRPFIDDIAFEKDGKQYRRVPEVLDCWFESGSMPFAQDHYPFEGEARFDKAFPADYIGEGLDQTRLWFYVLHVLSTIVTGKPAYKNVLVNGMIMAADGQKLSKRLKNYPPVEDVFANEGADTLRLYLLGSDPALTADYMRFDRAAMGDLKRNVLMTLWNSYSFLGMYAETADWHMPEQLVRPVSENILDAWMLARLDEAIQEITVAADAYRLAGAVRSLRELIDDLSNWYVRRSRARFKAEGADRMTAFVTLHYVLCRIAQLLAPWAPFISDKLWRGLTKGMDVPSSVHLSDWPKTVEVDTKLLEDMKRVREDIASGLAIRAAAKLKVRQPLAEARVREDLWPYETIIREELNVKTVLFRKELEVELDLELTPELRAEGLVRDVVRVVQQARKDAGLVPGEHIRLFLETSDAALSEAIGVYRADIMAETLANELMVSGASDTVPVKVASAELFVKVENAA